jgi:hypothetical protein
MEGEKRVRSWGLHRKWMRRVVGVMSRRLWPKGYEHNTAKVTFLLLKVPSLVKAHQDGVGSAYWCEPASLRTSALLN